MSKKSILLYSIIGFILGLLVCAAWQHAQQIPQESADSQNRDEASYDINVLKTPAREGSGLEYYQGQWIAIDDGGSIFFGEKEVYKGDEDLEGVALCSDMLYVAVERQKDILVFDTDFNKKDPIPFGIGSGNEGAEGIACAPRGLYVTEQNGSTIYEIDTTGKVLDSFEVTHADLSGADYDEGTLYVLSDEDDVVMLVRDGAVQQEIPLTEQKEWEGIKVRDGKIYIIEDDES